MAAKRSNVPSVKDINPQWYHVRVSQAANDVGINQVFSLPQARLAGKTETVLVFEVLKVVYTFETIHGWTPNFGVSPSMFCEAVLSTRNVLPLGAGLAAADGGVISSNRVSTFGLLQNAGAGNTVATRSIFSATEFDLTDGAGNGVLVGTDNLNLAIMSFNTNAANFVKCDILYRFRPANLIEYVGIVQSQSGAVA